MIQRIQSLYLILVVVNMIVALFVPLAQFNTIDSLYQFTAQGVSSVGDVAAETIPTWGVFALDAVIAAVALVTIFLYKNRPIQAKLCIINAFFLVTFFIVIFLSIYSIREDLGATGHALLGNLAFPLSALVFDILAYRAINRDEQLVRSLDRIR